MKPLASEDEIIRQAMVLVAGTIRFEALYKKRFSMPQEEYEAEYKRITLEAALEYGDTFDEDCGLEQMQENCIHNKPIAAHQQKMLH